MSFVGKVLIVVQVVMSLCFMAFAGAVYVTHDNWKSKYEQSEQNVQKINQDLTTQRAAATQAQQEKERLETDLRQESEKNLLAFQMEQSQVQDLTARLNTVTTALERQTALSTAAQTEAKNREQETEVLRSQNVEFQKRNQEVQVELNSERDKSFNTEVSLRQLEDRYNRLQVQTAFLEKVVRLNGLKTDPVEVARMQAPPPRLDALVKEVQKGKTNRTEYVVITIGADDGLEVGHRLEAMGKRDNRTLYLGTLKVIQTHPQDAVCEVVTPGKLGDIEVGDNVTTNL